MKGLRGGFRQGQRFGRRFRGAGGEGGDGTPPEDTPEGLVRIGESAVKLGTDYVVLTDG